MKSENTDLYLKSCRQYPVRILDIQKLGCTEPGMETCMTTIMVVMVASISILVNPSLFWHVSFPEGTIAGVLCFPSCCVHPPHTPTEMSRDLEGWGWWLWRTSRPGWLRVQTQWPWVSQPLRHNHPPPSTHCALLECEPPHHHPTPPASAWGWWVVEVGFSYGPSSPTDGWRTLWLLGTGATDD